MTNVWKPGEGWQWQVEELERRHSPGLPTPPSFDPGEEYSPTLAAMFWVLYGFAMGVIMTLFLSSFSS